MDAHIPKEARADARKPYLYTGEHLAVKTLPPKAAQTFIAPLKRAVIGGVEVGLGIQSSESDLCLIAQVGERRFFISGADLAAAAHKATTGGK